MSADFTTMMQAAIDRKLCTAAELLVAQRDTITHHAHYGEATAQTVFDLASLTKPLVTATRCMQLVTSSALTLADRASTLLPELADGPYAKVTLRHLLTHTAGFPAWLPDFYQQLPRGLIGTPDAYRQLVQRIVATPPHYPPGRGYTYSDLGYILCGLLLERVSGRGLETQFHEAIARPLHMTRTGFLPLPESGRHTYLDRTGLQCVPTEDCPWRGAAVCGVVHDYTGYAIGGVAGHAGLFSTASDLHHFAQALLTTWHSNGEAPVASGLPGVSPAVLHQFLDRSTPRATATASHLCGWDTPSGKQSAAGRHRSSQTIGHLGFTGCSLWIDLRKERTAILLTNASLCDLGKAAFRAWRSHLHEQIL